MSEREKKLLSTSKEVTCDPPADDSDDEEAEGQRMLKDAPEAGCSLGERALRSRRVGEGGW